MGGGIVSNSIYFVFLLIMTFLILTNYKGLTEIMKQGGATAVPVFRTLQGQKA